MKKILNFTTILLIIALSIHNLKAQDEEYTIDNFAPYIKKVEISTGGEIIYSEEWIWDSQVQQLKYTGTCVGKVVNGTYDVIVSIYPSEVMANISLSIEGLIQNVQALSYWDNTNEFQYIISAADIKTIIDAQVVKFLNITINGQDMNGNLLQGFNKTQNSIPLSDLKRRISPDEWTQGGNFGPDTRHILRTGQTSDEIYACLLADFSATKTQLEGDEKAVFKNNSVGAATYQWKFEGGNPSLSNLETPEPVTYPNEGTFSVLLTVTSQDGMLSHTETKTGYITVIKNEASLSELDFTYDPTENKLTGKSSSEVDTWQWYLLDVNLIGETQIINPDFPQMMVSYPITLKVKYKRDGSVKIKKQTIYPCGYPFTN